MHAHSLRSRRSRALALWMIPALLLLTSCGAGGEGATTPPPGPGVVAPSNLTFANLLAVYRTDTPITPVVPSADGDPVTGFEIDPPLPAGLVMDPLTGIVTGALLAPTPPTDYDITASNAGGSTTATVNVTVLWHESKSLLAKAAVTDSDLRHFLDRTHFGFSQAHYDALVAAGLASYVDTMTTYADTSGIEADATAIYYTNDQENDPNGDFPSESDLARWWQYLMIVNPNPFQEMMAFHWHEHFAANSNVLSNSARHFFKAYMNLFRHGGAGNLRTLMLNMALDDAMLVFLDNILNQDGNINENFGREWFELFALGVDIDYTQQDIVEASRAFTGFRIRFDSQTRKNFIEFDPGRHDHEEKTILGQTIPAQTAGSGEVNEFDQVIDITLNHNEAGTGHSRVGQWIARSLLRYFCYDDPPQNVINELADDLRTANWEIKPILMKIFQSEAFFSAQAREGIVKGPVEHVMGFVRATNLLGDPGQIDNRLRLMGQRPSQPPGVDGWPGGTQWLSAQGMVDRANMLNYVTEQAAGIQAGLNIFAADLLPAPGADAGTTVDALAARLNVPLSPTERTECVTFMDTVRDNSGNVNPSPFNAASAAEIEERIRQCLWILGQHPTYMIR